MKILLSVMLLFSCTSSKNNRAIQNPENLIISENIKPSKNSGRNSLYINNLYKYRNDNFSVGKRYPQISSALALLTYLSYNETTLSKTNGKAVKELITYLMDLDPNKLSAMELSMVSYALNEAYSVTKIQELKPVCVKLLNRIIETTGSGKLLFAPKVSPVYQNFTIRALVSAKSDFGESLDLVKKSLKNCQTELIIYSENINSKNKFIEIASALNSALLLFHRNEKIPKNLVQSFKERFSLLIKKPKSYSLLSSYLCTDNCISLGGEVWRYWNSHLQDYHFSNQENLETWNYQGSLNDLGIRQNTSYEEKEILIISIIGLQLSRYYHFLPTGIKTPLDGYSPIEEEKIKPLLD